MASDDIWSSDDESSSDLGFNYRVVGFQRFLQREPIVRRKIPPPQTYPTVRELASRPLPAWAGGAGSDDCNLATLEENLVFKKNTETPLFPDDTRTSERFLYREKDPGFIYLVGHEEDVLLKIGLASDAQVRARKLHRPLIHTIRTRSMYRVEQRIRWIYRWRSAIGLGPGYLHLKELYALNREEIEEFKWFKDYDADRINFAWRIVERRRQLGYDL
jgi:hypothetical protein